MRRAAKIDRNHEAIARALTAAGCSVLSLAGLGNGAPDLLVGRNGRNTLLEIKSKGGSLTPYQETFHAGWRGDPVRVVWNVQDALNAVGITTSNGGR